MSAKATILSIDQGTTSSRAIVFDANGKALATAQKEFAQHYPHDGWVEHDPEAIWESVRAVTENAMADLSATAADITAIGITNQRETTLVWDRESGECIYNAIVWQDRRTAEACRALKSDGLEPAVAAQGRGPVPP